jgi:predicted transcriptional regulator YheO
MTQYSREWVFAFMKDMAEGIVAVVGQHCEVVVHDFRDIEHSVVAVSGNLTGRRPGAPVPDLSFLPEELEDGAPHQFNYRTALDGRSLQSSTVWIRDPAGHIIGAVCVNVDYASLLQARDILNALTAPAEVPAELVVKDTFAKDMNELIEKSVEQFLRKRGRADLKGLSRQERQDLIQELDRRGLFRIRGAADRLADLLNVSRASVYNYRTVVSEAAK